MKKRFLEIKSGTDKEVSYFQCEKHEYEMKWDKIIITWFASTPEIDRYNDIVRPEAFGKAMAEYMKNPVVLWQHYSEKILWTVTEYAITANGLRVKAELTNDIENTFQLIRDGALKGFSIGFIAKKWSYNVEESSGIEKEIREITDLDLVEISVVSTPANKSSLFTLTKSLKDFFDKIRETEKKALETTENDSTIVISENEEKPQENTQKVEENTKEEEKTTEPPEKTEELTEAPTEWAEIAGENPEPAENAESESEKTNIDVEVVKEDVEELKKTIASLIISLEEKTCIISEIQKELDEVKSLAESNDKAMKKIIVPKSTAFSEKNIPVDMLKIYSIITK